MGSNTSTAKSIDLSLLFNTLPGLLLVLDTELNIQVVSDAFLSATHKEREQIIGQNIIDIFSVEAGQQELQTLAKLQKSLKKVIALKKPQAMPVQRFDLKNPYLKSEQTEERYWKPLNIPVLNNSGELTAIIHQVKDVTKQQKQKITSKRNEELLQVVFQTINDVIWDWDLFSDKMKWSEGFNTKFGYSALEAEPTIESWYSRLHPEDKDRVMTGIYNVIYHGLEVWSDVYRFKQKNGSYASILDRGFVLRDATGEPYRMIGAMVDITATKKAEQEARASEARFRTIMESFPLMTWTALPTGEINYYNQRWTEYLGVPLPELYQKGWQKFIHPNDLEKTEKHWQQALAAGTDFEVENRWRSVYSQDYRWFLVRGVAIKNDKNEIVLWVGSHTDIEANKKWQAQLEAQDEKLQRVLTQAPAHFCLMKGPDMVIDLVTPGMVALLGNRPSIGLPAAQAWPEFKEQGFISLLEEVYRTGKSYSGTEQKVIYQNDESGNLKEGYFSFSYQPFYDKNHQIEGVLTVTVEVTDQVKAKQAAEFLTEELRSEKEKFEFLAESIPQFIWTTDPQGYHDYFNQRWIDYTGYDVESSQGTEMWKNLLHPDDRERARLRWEHSLQTGEFYQIEYRFKSKAGDYRWFLGQATPMRDAAGNIVKWFGSCTDIEQNKRAEEEMVLVNQELRKTNEDLDSFVYTASHDLKLPIISMSRIFSELSESVQFTTPDADILISMFHKSLDQINTTIQDLADIVKVQKNLEQTQEVISFTSVINQVQLSIQDFIKESGAQLKTDFSGAPEIFFSRVNLTSIMYNLVSNAIKYRSPDRAPLIRITTVKENQFILLTVQDNGLGINLDRHKGKLFQMFKRFHNHVPGSGIGLYIINRIVQNNGGYILVESEVNVGTTFKVYLKNKELNQNHTL